MTVSAVKHVEFTPVDNIPSHWQPLQKTINTYKLITGGNYYLEIFKDMLTINNPQANPYIEEFPNWFLNFNPTCPLHP